MNLILVMTGMMMILMMTWIFEIQYIVEMEIVCLIHLTVLYLWPCTGVLRVRQTLGVDFSNNTGRECAHHI